MYLIDTLIVFTVINLIPCFSDILCPIICSGIFCNDGGLIINPRIVIAAISVINMLTRICFLQLDAICPIEENINIQ